MTRRVNFLFMGNETDSLAKRIDARLEKIKETKAGLARHFGFSPQRINNWIVRGNIPSRELLLVSAYLGCRPEWLLRGDLPIEPPMVREPSARQRLSGDDVGWFAKGDVPAISWESAGSAELGELLATATTWKYCDMNHSDKTFALVIRDKSMTSDDDSIPMGYYICVDPEQKDSSVGDFVAARIENQKAATCRQLADAGGGKLFLKPLNSDWPSIYEGFEIIGKVIFIGRKL